MPTQNIVEILQVGVIGLGFLLALMAYRLLLQEMKHDKSRPSIIRAIYVFMGFSIVLCGIGVTSQLLPSNITNVTPSKTLYIVEILQVGVIGLGFLLALMAYRLLLQEMKHDKSRPSIIRAIYVFMGFSIVLCGIGVTSQLLPSNITNVTPSKTLLAVVENGDMVTVRNLLNIGTKPNIKNNNGDTALHLAASRGHIAIVKILLEKGAEIDAKNNWGETALYLATSKGDTAIVQELLDNGANINTKNNWGVTPLFMGVSKGYSSIVQILLASGSDVNARDNDGKTALMEATEKGYTDIVRALLEEGAEVHVESNYRLTALKIARERGRIEIAEILIQHGADD